MTPAKDVGIKPEPYTWWAWLWGVVAVFLLVAAFFLPFWMWSIAVLVGFGTLEGIGVFAKWPGMIPLTDVIYYFVPSWISIPLIWGFVVGAACAWFSYPHPLQVTLLTVLLGWFNQHFEGKYLVEKNERQAEAQKRRDIRALMEQSSLSTKSLWVDCPTHGRQARDPYTDRCILCRASGDRVSDRLAAPPDKGGRQPDPPHGPHPPGGK